MIFEGVSGADPSLRTAVRFFIQDDVEGAVSLVILSYAKDLSKTHAKVKQKDVPGADPSLRTAVRFFIQDDGGTNRVTIR